MKGKYSYEGLINIIKDTKKYCYECTDISSYASDYFFEIDEIDEISYFEDLMHYFAVESHFDENFSQVIDDLIEIIENNRRITKSDIHFILGKEKILKILSKYQTNKVSKETLDVQLKKYFSNVDLKEIFKYLEENSL